MLNQVQHDIYSPKRTYSKNRIRPLTLSRKGRGKGSLPFTLHPSLKKSAFTLADGATHVDTSNNIRRVAFTLSEGATHVDTTDNIRRVAFTLSEGATHVAHFDNVRKAAFTLAEVLITLGIIGVVAALTMPALINRTNKKELEVALKKTFSELNQASMMYYNNEGVSIPEKYGALTNSSPIPLADEFIKYFQGGHKYNNATYANVDEIEGYTIYHLNGAAQARMVCNNSGYYTDNIGRIFAFNDLPASSSENGPVLCVDVNGEKLPNKYGYDIFLFLFTVDGRVIPMGQEHKNNPTANSINTNGFLKGEDYCTKSRNGYSCAVFAINDTHPTEKGKTYWKDFIR